MGLRSWGRKVRRRKPGIYLARTEKHHRPGRYENGYVGRSVHLRLRRGCHYGTCRHRGCLAKPWTDLAPRWRSLRLPWWLGWKWVLAPLEALAILLLMPRYNDRLNRHNPRRVTLLEQRRQRAVRDTGSASLRLRRTGVRWAYAAMQVAGVALIVAGLTGYAMTRN